MKIVPKALLDAINKSCNSKKTGEFVAKQCFLNAKAFIVKPNILMLTINYKIKYIGCICISINAKGLILFYLSYVIVTHNNTIKINIVTYLYVYKYVAVM